VISIENKKYIYRYYMDWTLILLIALFILLIYMNYKKIIRKTYSRKNKTIGGNDSKKVRWDLAQAAKESAHQNPLVDFFDGTTNRDGLVLEGNAISSDIVKYLNKQSESYGSKVYSVNPTKAWIPEDPDILVDRNNFTAHEIIGEEEPNTRVHEFREGNTNGFEGNTIGEVYDNMVDNFRVKWGQFEGLGAYDPTSYYSLEVNPDANGYTDFATY
jgi:hypothetical protein